MERAGAVHPDLICLDLQMPKMDGFEVALMLKSDPSLRDIPIVVITGHPDDRMVVDSVGIRDVFLKPFPIADLVSRVEQLLASDALQT